MIKMFEGVTAKISRHERCHLVPMLKSTLSATNKKNRFTGKHLVGWFKASGEHTSEPRIRKMILFLRASNAFKGKMIIGSGKGYFISKNATVVDDQIKSLEDRITAQKFTLKNLRSQRNALRRTG